MTAEEIIMLEPPECFSTTGWRILLVTRQFFLLNAYTGGSFPQYLEEAVPEL